LYNQPVKSIPLLAERWARHGLRLAFGFDAWHTSAYGERPYAADIVRYLNSRGELEAAVEIGAGLGDIIRRVRCGRRVAMDKDPGALRACRFLARLRGLPIELVAGEFPAARPEGLFDAVVMVNWIHNVEPAVLREGLRAVFGSNLKPGGALLFDTVKNPSYRHNHDPAFLLEGLPCAARALGSYEYGRTVHAAVKEARS
jgi:hypothetical protein